MIFELVGMWMTDEVNVVVSVVIDDTGEVEGMEEPRGEEDEKLDIELEPELQPLPTQRAGESGLGVYFV